MSELLVVGLSHRTAPLAVRERLAFSDDALVPAVREIGALPTVGEAMLLSTCNRVEIYAAARSDPPAAVAEIRRYLSTTRQIEEVVLATHVYDRVGPAAVQHVFRVAASLDSLVVGEPQILGQLKDAYGVATGAGAVGPVLGRCVERAFGVAKRVRTETSIARGAANVSSVAVELATKVFGDLEGKTVLVIGAGKMSALAARHLIGAGATDVVVVNRSPQRAEALAADIGGAAQPWDKLEDLLGQVDVVVSSTGAQQPIIGKALMKQVMKLRRHRPIFLIDIAVPRDVESEAGKLDGVYLFDIDDLERVVVENRKGRERESASAEKIVEEETRQFIAWLRQQTVTPTLKALRERFHAVALAEVKKLGDDEAQRRLAEAIIGKLLHSPLMAIKQDDALAAAARKLFALPEDEGKP
jgi:glutamyl-tRNA reductase